jgi:hypothetical protein
MYYSGIRTVGMSEAMNKQMSNYIQNWTLRVTERRVVWHHAITHQYSPCLLRWRVCTLLYGAINVYTIQRAKCKHDS